MRLFIVLLAVVVTARGSAILGEDKCTWGPSYWCTSLQTASTCDAFFHCLDNVWVQQKLDVQQTDLCVSSQKVLRTASKVLTVDGKVQKSAVTAICDLVKDDKTKQECQDVLSKYLPEVIKLVESGAEPSSVSALLGLCQLHDGHDSSVETDTQTVGETAVCQDCHKFITDIRKAMDTPEAEEQLSHVLVETVCSQLDDLVIWCKAAVESGLPKLFKFLEKNDESDMLCGLGHFCGDSDTKVKEHIVYKAIDTVFNEIEMDTDAEVICHGCEKALSSVLAFDKDSPVRTSVEHAIGQLCSQTGLDEDRCLQLSEGLTQIPQELLHMVSRDVDVKKVCQSTLSCSGDESERTSPDDLQPPPVDYVIQNEPHTPESPYCTECLRVCGSIKEALKAEGSASWATANAKQAMCKQVGMLEEECNNIVDSFMPLVVQWMATDDGPQFVCSEMHACPKSIDFKTFDFIKTFDSITEKKPLGDFKCDECMILVEDARAADRNPDVQKAIMDFFNNVCDQLGQEAQQCKVLVQQYAPELFEIIAAELDPSVVCELLLHCTKPDDQTAESDGPVLEEKPESVEIVEDSSPSEKQSPNHSGNQSQMEKKKAMQKVKKVDQKAAQRVGNALECSVCHLVMENIDNAIASNSTEQELQRVLGDVCDLLPSDWKEPCGQFVDTYTPTIIQLLLQQLNPLMICDELQLCNDSKTDGKKTEELKEKMEEDDGEEEVKEDKEEEKEVGDSVECELCKQVMGTLDKLLEENKTEMAIEKALEEVCDMLPQEIKSQCLSFVDEYAPVVVQLLVEELLQPQQVCDFLGLCKQEQISDVKYELPVPTEPSVPSEQYGGPLCPVCDAVITELDEVLANNKSEAAVQNALERVCSIFPDSSVTHCFRFINVHADEVISLLMQDVRPKDICREMRVCSSPVKVRVSLPTKDSATRNLDDTNSSQNRKGSSSVQDSEVCTICQELAVYAGEALKEQSTVDEVEKLLDDICTTLPDKVTATCKTIVEQFTPLVLQLLAEEDNPLHFCQSIKLCPSTAPRQVQSALLGEYACTYGPAFWCASMDNARKCGMVEECTEKYGMKP